MAKKRNHPVTRSILKSFPDEAVKVLGKEKDNHVGKKIVKRTPDDDKSDNYQSEGSGMEDEEEVEDLESLQDYSEDDSLGDDQSVDFDASSGTDEEELDEDEFSEAELEKSHQKKNPKEKSLGMAISQILKQNIPAPSEDAPTSGAPILAKRKATERGIEDAKLDARARTLLKRQKNASKDSARVLVPDATKANYERALRKSATRGVVQLFNAIHQHQVNKEKLAKERKDSGKGKGEIAKEIKQISKTSFLEMLKGGASSIAIRK